MTNRDRSEPADPIWPEENRSENRFRRTKSGFPRRERGRERAGEREVERKSETGRREKGGAEGKVASEVGVYKGGNERIGFVPTFRKTQY